MSGTGIRSVVCAAAIGCVAVLSACSSTVDGRPLATDAPTTEPTVEPQQPDSGIDGTDPDVKVTHPKRVGKSTDCQSVLTVSQTAEATGWETEESGYSEADHCFYTLTPQDDGIGTVSIRVGSGATGRTTELAGNTAFVLRSNFGCMVAITVAERADYSEPDQLQIDLNTSGSDVSVDESCQVAEKLAVAGFENLPDA